MQTHEEKRTIQLWPSGRAVTYRGDWRNPSELRTETKPGGGFECACAGDARDICTEERARLYQERDILCLDSMLVDHLLRSGVHGFGYEEIVNVYPDPSEWSAQDCKDWLEDHVGTEYNEDDSEDTLRIVVRDYVEPADIMEWYRVTEWLADELEIIGEPVLSNEYGDWWGRCATGQGLIMDGTLQQIAAKHQD